MQSENLKSKPSLADKIYHLIYSRILNGDYVTNEKLPPENNLAQELQVSRPVLRTALQKLRKEGLIYSRQGAGSYVRSPKASPVGFARVETIADIQRCYEFRLNLETKAAELAAQRHNAENLIEIEQALDLLRVATGTRQHREDADFSFHLAIAKASNNQYFEASLQALREHINVGMTLHGQSLMTEGALALEKVLAEHAEIFEAIRDRRCSDAAALMQQHLEHSRDRLFGGGLLDLSK